MTDKSPAQSKKLTDAEFAFLEECDREPDDMETISDRLGMPLRIAEIAVRRLRAQGLIEPIGETSSGLLWTTTIDGYTLLRVLAAKATSDE